MARNFNILIIALVFMAQSVLAQTSSESSILSESVAKNPEQTRNYMKGTEAFPSKPKDMWEIGIHGGLLQYAGDVNPDNRFHSWGAGLHARKSLGYTFALRFDAMYGKVYGMNFKGNNQALARNNALNGRNNALVNYYTSSPNGSGFIWNYESEYMQALVEGIITLNNLKFHKRENKVDLFIMAGLGANAYNTRHNALNGNNSMYDFTALNAEYASFNTDHISRSERRELYDNYSNLLDDTYETQAERNADNNFLIDDKYTLSPTVSVGLGVGYRLNKRMSLTLEHRASFQDDDNLDGYAWSEQGDRTQSVDVVHYSNLRVNFHLGSFDKRVMPLWWMNPLEANNSELAKLKSEFDPKNLFADEDNDGVVDYLDQEPDTKEDCPVDTKGRTLDSDKDGVVDCEDKELFSPPGYPVDPQGVAQVPDYVTEDDVLKLADKNDWVNKPVQTNNTSNVANSAADWWLPMIHFDLDKYYIKPAFYDELHHVAMTMKKNPGLKVVVTGFTDARLPNQYNQVLSWKRANAAVEYLTSKYGVNRSDLILQYKGEETPLVEGLGDNHTGKLDIEYRQYMNRRVEFTVSNGTETDMGRPEYPGWEKVGSNTPRSSRGGKIYSGNNSYD